MPIIESNKKDLLVDRIALFDKSKMIMELSPSESETYRLMTTGIYDESLKVKNKKVMLVMNLEKGKANYKLKHQNKNIVANYTIKVRAVIEEKIDGLDSIKESDISELNKQLDLGGAVQLVLSNKENELCIQVTDTGIGIKPEDHARIFDRFYRSDKSRSRQIGSHGLGLAIAKWIVEIHNGTIQVNSEVGKGSTFTIQIPTSNNSKKA
ncbi:hypothetical protein CN514_10760 [Bacillus sp. AFS001701]|nr:hypothetical protein CN514_10760 [Bacillus sp. AFS001701]